MSEQQTNTGSEYSLQAVAQAKACTPNKGDRWWAWQHKYAPYLFISPFLILFVIFMLYPLGRSIVLSVYKTAGPRTQRFVGLGNFAFILQDKLFWLAVWNTLIYAGAFIILQIPFSLGLALLLNSKVLRWRNALRFAFFSPHLVGSVFVAVIFLLLLSKNGPVNQFIMRTTGAGEGLGWMSDPVAARLAVIIAALWLSVGYGMVYFLAALQSVDRELYEAAQVDGAGPWARFWHITVPGIRPVLIFLLLVGTIGALQMFELPYVLFQGAGPGLAGLTIVSYLFQWGFEVGDIGYAASVGWILVFIILGVTIAQVRMTHAMREE